MRRRIITILGALLLVVATMVGATSSALAMSQVVIGGYAASLSSVNTIYNYVQGGYYWVPFADTTAREVVSTAGTFSRLSVELSTDPGTAPDAYTFTLLVNGSPSTLTLSIVADDTTGVDDTHVVDVVAGDYISLRCEPIEGPSATPTARWSLVFEGATANESLVLGAADPADVVNTFYAPLSTGSCGTDPTLVYQIIPTAGTVKNLYVWLASDPGTSPGAWVYTLCVNGSPTSLTCTVVADDITGHDSTHSVSVSAGDYVCLEIKPQDSPGPDPSAAHWGLTFVATTDGESLILGQSGDTPTNSQTEYNYLTNIYYLEEWTTTEYFQGGQAPTGSMVLKKFYVQQSGVSGSGKTWTYTIRGGGGSTDLIVPITGASATTGNDTTHTYTCTAYDDLAVMATPTSTPTERMVYWGLVCYIAVGTPNISVNPNTKDFGVVLPATTYWAKGSAPTLGSQVVTRNATAQTADGTGWTDPTNAYTSNNLYASGVQTTGGGTYPPAGTTNGTLMWTDPQKAYSSDNNSATVAPTYAATTNKNPTATTNGTLPWTNGSNAYTSDNNSATVAPTYGATTSKQPSANASGSYTQWTNPANAYDGGSNQYAVATVAETATTEAPTAGTGTQWTNPTYAYAQDTNYASSATDGYTHIYKTYAFALTGVVTKVRVNVRGYTATNDDIKVELSLNSGSSWLGTSSTVEVGTGSPGNNWVDATTWDAGGWTVAEINNGNIQARVTHSKDSGTDTVYLDYLPIEVTVIPATQYDQVYNTFGITDPGSRTVTKVEVGYEAYCSVSNNTVNFYTSNTSGASWHSIHTSNAWVTSDPGSYTYIDVTADQTWDFSSLGNGYFKIKIETPVPTVACVRYLDNLIVRVTYDDRRAYDQLYNTFGLTDPLNGTGSTITKVELGYEAWATATGNLTFYTSNDSGGTWSTAHTTPNLGTTDPNSYTYIDCTSDFTWDWTHLGNGYLKIKMVTVYASGTPAWSTDALVIRVTYDDRRNYDQIWGTYGITGSATITKVEVGYEAWATATGNLTLYTSNDSGGTWGTAHTTSNLGTTDPNSTTWIDCTSDFTWSWTGLGNGNFKVKVLTKYASGTPAWSLDYLPVKITCSAVNPSTIYGTYGYSITVSPTKVEVGVEGYTSAGSAKNLAVYTSNDSGSTWSGKHTFSLGTSDNDSVTWIDCSGDFTWTATTVNNTNFKVKMTDDAGDTSTEYVDYIPARITYDLVLADGDCTFYVSNDGSMAVKVSFNATDFIGNPSGNWPLASSANATHCALSVYVSGNSTGTALTSTATELIPSLANGNVKYWELKLETPTSDPFPDGNQKECIITLTAVAA